MDIQKFNIYSPEGKLVFSDFVDDSSYRLTEIMGENTLKLYFSLNQYVSIIEGSYCDFKTERYWLPRAAEYKEEHSQKFDYTLNMEGSVCFLKSTKFKFFAFVTENGKIKPTSSFKLKFPFTATPRMVADLIVANLRLKYPQYPWAVGECIESEPVVLDYNHHFCFGVLADVADKFKTEWELDKFTLSFGKVEKMKDSAIDLSYGYDNGILGGIRRMQYDNTRIINRVYIESGERNIDRSTYGRDRNPSGSDTLLLSKSKIITYEGIDYTTDTSGSYLERLKPLAGEEDSLDLTKIYPKRIGTVSAVEVINDSQGLYNIIDSSIPADLDYSKMIIAGETMTVIFQTGQLAGKEFDVKYIHDKRKFELVPIDQNGLIYPQGHLIPAVGDTYAVFHMRMPEMYITNAENEALQETVKYLWEGEQPQYTYRWQLDAIFAKRKWGAIRGFLNIGYFVRFSDPQFLPESVDVRIVAVKEPANDPQSPEITIANNVSGRTLGSVISQIPSVEQAVDRKDSDMVNYAKRGFKQSNETMQKLIDSMLDFDGAIKPIAVQTMMMLVGDESLQFRYVDKRDNPTAKSSGINYDQVNKRLVCPVGIMQHMTLDITSLSSSHKADEYKFWDCKAYQSDVLTDPRKSYFLYLKCSKTDYSNGVYLISEDAIKMEAVTGYYHFLVGILNTEDDETNRSFIEMFGFTEIMPGRILTDLITNSEGNFIINLVHGLLEIFNGDKSMIKLNGNDGSGHLAGGNLLWDLLGNIAMLNATLRIKDDEGRDIIRLDGGTGAAILGKGTILLNADGSASFGAGKNVLNADGSGSLADGNITFDSNGNVEITGKFDSNKDGKRITIDPAKQTIEMYTSAGYLAASFGFFEITGGISAGQIISYSRDSSGNVLGSSMMRGGTISVYKGRPSTPDVLIYSEGDTFQFMFNMNRLPSSRDNAIVSTLYRNGENICIRTS